MTGTDHVPAHHPAEELLIDYAAGAQSAAQCLMIGTHLALCGTCRRTIAVLDAAGGALLDDLSPVRLPPNMLNRTLAAIDLDRPQTDACRSDLRATLLARASSKEGAWRTLPGGMRMHRLADDGGALRSGQRRVWLCDAPPGLRMLPHRHSGEEWTVVLAGEIIDESGTYRPGDFACAPDGSRHRPRAGRGARCVSLSMVRDSPRYTSVIGRLAAPFIRF